MCPLDTSSGVLIPILNLIVVSFWLRAAGNEIWCTEKFFRYNVDLLYEGSSQCILGLL
jgi:hypothetical protein